MRALLLLSASLLPLGPAATIPPGPDAANGQQQELGIKSDANDRMTVPVRVSDRGPYRFLIDTGAERTVISRQLAERLGLTAGVLTTLQSVMGTSSVATVDIPALQVSSRNLSVPSAPALEEDNIGADGMLGVDSLSGQRVMLDFKRGSMGIAPSRTAVEPVDGDTIVVTARRKHGRLLISDATLDGHDAVVVVDTGSQISIGNEALRRKLGRHVALTTEIETVTGEKAMADVVTVRFMRIGGMTLMGTNIAFLRAPVFHQLDLDTRPAMLLGMNVMRAFDRVSIDFATGKVRFVLPGTSMIRETRMASR